MGQRNDLAEIRDLLATRLPSSYEPMLLTFYGPIGNMATASVKCGVGWPPLIRPQLQTKRIGGR